MITLKDKAGDAIQKHDTAYFERVTRSGVQEAYKSMTFQNHPEKNDDLATYALRNGADAIYFHLINPENGYGNLVPNINKLEEHLELASTTGAVRVVRALIEKTQAAVADAVDAADYADYADYADAAEADVDEFYTKANLNRYLKVAITIALRNVVLNGNVETLRNLLGQAAEAGVNVRELRYTHNIKHWFDGADNGVADLTLLHFAGIRKDIGIFNLLHRDHEFSLEDQDTDGFTPIDRAKEKCCAGLFNRLRGPSVFDKYIHQLEAGPADEGEVELLSATP